MNNKKIIGKSVVGALLLILLVVGVTYAFFNYTRTGAPNRISVGDIYFTSDYTNVELDGIFPISKAIVGTDTDNVMSVNVNIEGHTTYTHGIYYEITAEDVSLQVNGKNVPIGIRVTSSDLENVTLTNYEDGKVLTDGSLFANGRILASDATHDNSVGGTITITAYLDKDKIAISDTYNGLQTDLMGTTTGWVNGRVVLSTAEWNSLANTPLSFKVKVEAFENDVSTLTPGPVFNYKVKRLSGSLTDEFLEQVSTYFESFWNETSQEDKDKLFEEFGISTYQEFMPYILTDYTSDESITTFQRVNDTPDTSEFTDDNIISTENSIYPIYAWYDNGVIKYYSETNNIKFNTYMVSMFQNLFSLTSIGELADLDTTNVTVMYALFKGCTSFEDLNEISSWNTSNVTSMGSMFDGCSAIIDFSALSNWNVLNVDDMSYLFYSCEGLVNLLALSNWNTSNLTKMNSMFASCTNLSDISALSDWDTSNVTNMIYLFHSCEGITNINALSNWNVSKVTDMSRMFLGVGITNLNALSNWNTSNVTSMNVMFAYCSNLIDVSGINDWDINNVDANNYGFYRMFEAVSVHPEFTKRAGTWDAQGTFIPSA